MLRFRPVVALALAAAAATPASRGAAPEAHAVAMPAFRIDESGFGAREADIRAVLDSAGRELWRHFPDHRIEPFVVVRGDGGPITLFERNERREIVIRLDTEGTSWCQYAYQFSHEFCHVLCGSKPGDRSNLWLEESLCEAASVYAIRGMARTWRTHPPYPNWHDYRDSLRDYADEVLLRRPQVDDIAAFGLPAFFAKHAERLRANPVDRDLNGSIAVVLLRLLEERPEHWESVRWLNAATTDAPRSLADHLAAWHAAVPEAHRPFVARLATLFGTPAPATP